LYKITKEKFGFQLTFGGTIGLDEMLHWRDDARTVLIGARKTFGVLIDMRTLRPGGVQPDAQAVMVEGQGLFKTAGMERSCVILESAAVTMQFERLAKQSGIYSFERYINAAAHPDWQVKALSWIERKIDPGH
jgi:hypothetical protein